MHIIGMHFNQRTIATHVLGADAYQNRPTSHNTDAHADVIGVPVQL
jgi:hypothetical protein